MDELWNATVAAVVPQIPIVVGALVATLVAWLGKNRAVKSNAETAALDAEKALPGPGQGPKRKLLAVKTLSGTLSGKFTSLAALEDAVEEHGMAAITRESEHPKPLTK